VLEYRGHVRQDIGWLVQLFPFNPNNPAHPDDQIVSDANQQNLVGRALKSVFIFANIDDLYHINAYGGHGIYTFSKKLCDILTPFGVKMKALCQWCDKNKGESLENYLVKLQDYAKHY
jgi:hypothetical protein